MNIVQSAYKAAQFLGSVYNCLKIKVELGQNRMQLGVGDSCCICFILNQMGVFFYEDHVRKHSLYSKYKGQSILCWSLLNCYLALRER